MTATPKVAPLLLRGWVPLKQFCHEEAVRDGVDPNSVFHRIQRGNYYDLPLAHINSRVVLCNPAAARVKPLARAIEAGWLVPRRAKPISKERERLLAMKRMCMARLRAEQRGQDLSRFPKRVRARKRAKL